MKVKKILIIAVFLAAVVGAKAQTGVATGTQWGSGQDSLNCRRNLSLVSTNIGVNNYAEAYPLWKSAYEECPASTSNLYMWGEQIIKWQISEATDDAAKESFFNDLMALYDKRIKYFGDVQRYNTNWIMARKATEYIEFKKENMDPVVLYGWLKPMIDEYQANTEPRSISYYLFASQKLRELDQDKYTDQFIQDFLKCSAIFDEKLEMAKAANDETMQNTVIALKASAEQAFTTSGAADCATMERVYASKIEENKADLEFLKATLTLFRRVVCIETETYFAAANYAHKIEPTAESAIGLANQAVNRKDYNLAEKYYMEAAEMSSDNEQKGSIYYSIAYLTSVNSPRNYQKIKQYCLRALEVNPNHGKAYLLIGLTYANSFSSISDDAVIRKTAFWAAVDKFQRARQVDPSCAEDANRYINQYSQYFPTAGEVFMHPDLPTQQGEAYTVGGWINERTTVRVIAN